MNLPLSKRFRKAVLAGVAATAAVAVLPAVPALASPLGTGPVCDRESPYQICLSADGTSGDGVVGEHYSTDNQEHTTVAAANVCGGTDVVDGGNTTCPFSQGTGHLNDKYKGDIIIQMYNTAENNLYYLGGKLFKGFGEIYQGAKGTGYLYVLNPISSGGSIYYLVNVSVSSNTQTPYFACSVGVNEVPDITDSFTGGGRCEWAFP